ncbi:MAG: oxidoreductase [Ignavibacteriae bacterium HGW-Ignavibacteriae-2]|jgi:predicted dehydrogenase|nr:MAG: oxidoreductase [Ignavibacteriae bacterium HGW-Ignavibacteriae-2]
MKEVRWGFIGCGDVTEIKSGPAFNKISRSQIIAVMRRDGEKAKDYAKRHNIPKWYNDASALINDPDINAIYVATPPSTHAEYTIKSAEAGKAVYVEKPMAASYNECLRMIDSCEKNNVPLFVAYYRRRLPQFVKVKELIDSGIIGEVKFLNIALHLKPYAVDFEKDNLPWRVKPEIAGSGYFYDLASHQFDYLDFLFGVIAEASGCKNNQAGLYDAEDVVTASWIFGNGILGSGSWCFTAPDGHEKDQIEIIGSKGKIVFPTFNRDPINLFSDNINEKFINDWPMHVHQPLLESVISELLGNGISPSTGKTAARTNWVMDRILKKI